MNVKIDSVKVGLERTNCYVISLPSGETIVIDPGAESDKVFELLEKIKNLNLKYILLTHGHFDHVGAVDILKESFPKTPVVIGEADVGLYEDLTLQGTLVGRLLHKQMAELEVVSEGDFLPFGEYNIEVIYTPGHTPGGVCYLLEKCLFTGDTLFYHTIGRTDLPFSSDKDMRLSLAKLSRLDDNLVIYPGHGRETTIAGERGIYLR